MNELKQKLIIEHLISSSDLFIKCYSIIKPNYFNPEFRICVEFIITYYEKYSAIPSVDIIKAESEVDLEIHEVTKDSVEFIADTIELHCQTEAMVEAIRTAAGLIAEGKKDQILKIVSDATIVSLQKDLGLDYFDDPEKRLQHLLESEDYQPTGLSGLDELLGGGLVRKQMIVVSGNAGTGKSISLSNIGLNLLEANLNVCYISLELSEALVSLRFDGLITNFDQTGWQDRIEETATILKQSKNGMGSLVIKFMESGTPSKMIKSYLKEYELEFKRIPDVLIVDYLDIMGANSGISSESVFEKDKQVSEELRNLGNAYDMFVLTASQQNRSAVGLLDTDQSHIAGGISKANTADFWFSIILTDAMKAEGEIAYKCIKSRTSDGVGKTRSQTWNNKSLRIGNLGEDPIEKRILATKQQKIEQSDISRDIDSIGIHSDLVDMIN